MEDTSDFCILQPHPIKSEGSFTAPQQQWHVQPMLILIIFKLLVSEFLWVISVPSKPARQSAETRGCSEIRDSPSWNINEIWMAGAIGGEESGCWRWEGQGELQALVETHRFPELELWTLDGSKNQKAALVSAFFTSYIQIAPFL